MPHVTKRAKSFIKDGFTAISAGELNYELTLAVRKYLETNGNRNSCITYKIINDVIGALESCKLEFYRQVVVPYEEEKGDVY